MTWPFVPRPLYNLRNRLRYRLKEIQFNRRSRRGQPFRESELLFAAHARCKGCGAGLAYHEGIGPRGHWDCSRVLTGEADPEERDSEGNHVHLKYPFVFYEIKSEDQPSAGGATTRPRRD